MDRKVNGWMNDWIDGWVGEPQFPYLERVLPCLSALQGCEISVGGWLEPWSNLPSPASPGQYICRGLTKEDLSLADYIFLRAPCGF